MAPYLAASVASVVTPKPAAPAPRPANMPDLAGTWPGDADGAPLQLTLRSAGGPKMTGTAQIVTPDGTKNIAVTGTWKEDRLELAGRGDALLFGYLRAEGGNGTLMFPGMDPFAWQVAP